MPDEKFKLPQSSYEELCKIIKSYYHFDEPAGLEEISKLAGLHTTMISGNAGFLTSVGILEPGAKKILSSPGHQLGHALEHNIEEEVLKAWRSVVIESEFLRKLLSAIKIRGGMDQATLEAHIAYSAGQPKKRRFMTGARAIIDILRLARFVADKDGKVVFESAEEEFDRAAASQPKPSEFEKTRPEAVQPQERPQISSLGGTGLAIHININISCTANDLDGLAEKLSKLTRELSDIESADEDNQVSEE